MKLTGAQMVLSCLEAENVDIVLVFPGCRFNSYDEIYKKACGISSAAMSRALSTQQTDMPGRPETGVVIAHPAPERPIW